MNGMGYRLRWMDDIDIDVDVRGMSIFTSSDQRIDAALTLRYVSFTFHRSFTSGHRCAREAMRQAFKVTMTLSAASLSTSFARLRQ